MPLITLDPDGYPTDGALERVKEWSAMDLEGLFDFMRILWKHPEHFTGGEAGVYEISTGGWSGNEDVLAALAENAVAWTMTFAAMRRGGHYIFVMPATQVEITLCVKIETPLAVTPKTKGRGPGW